MRIMVGMVFTRSKVQVVAQHRSKWQNIIAVLQAYRRSEAKNDTLKSPILQVLFCWGLIFPVTHCRIWGRKHFVEYLNQYVLACAPWLFVLHGHFEQPMELKILSIPAYYLFKALEVFAWLGNCLFSKLIEKEAEQ